MKSLWVIVFGLLAAIFAAVFTLAIYATLHDENKEAPEAAARNAECRKLMRHLIDISPERGDRSADELAGKVPIEDIEQCGAAYPEAVACMQAATDMKGVRECIPAGVACEGPETTVEGNHPIFAVSGKCEHVVVKTSKAFIVLKSAKSIDLLGDDNKLRTAADAVTVKGARNVIQVQAREDKKDVAIKDEGTGTSIEKPTK